MVMSYSTSTSKVKRIARMLGPSYTLYLTCEAALLLAHAGVCLQHSASKLCTPNEKKRRPPARTGDAAPPCACKRNRIMVRGCRLACFRLGGGRLPVTASAIRVTAPRHRPCVTGTGRGTACAPAANQFGATALWLPAGRTRIGSWCVTRHRQRLSASAAAAVPRANEHLARPRETLRRGPRRLDTPG